MVRTYTGALAPDRRPVIDGHVDRAARQAVADHAGRVVALGHGRAAGQWIVGIRLDRILRDAQRVDRLEVLHQVDEGCRAVLGDIGRDARIRVVRIQDERIAEVDVQRVRSFDQARADQREIGLGNRSNWLLERPCYWNHGNWHLSISSRVFSLALITRRTSANLSSLALGALCLILVPRLQAVGVGFAVEELEHGDLGLAVSPGVAADPRERRERIGQPVLDAGAQGLHVAHQFIEGVFDALILALGDHRPDLIEAGRGIAHMEHALAVFAGRQNFRLVLAGFFVAFGFLFRFDLFDVLISGSSASLAALSLAALSMQSLQGQSAACFTASLASISFFFASSASASFTAFFAGSTGSPPSSSSAPTISSGLASLAQFLKPSAVNIALNFIQASPGKEKNMPWPRTLSNRCHIGGISIAASRIPTSSPARPLGTTAP